MAKLVQIRDMVMEGGMGPELGGMKKGQGVEMAIWLGWRTEKQGQLG